MLDGGAWKLVGHGIWWGEVACGAWYLVGHGIWWGMVSGGVQ